MKKTVHTLNYNRKGRQVKMMKKMLWKKQGHVSSECQVVLSGKVRDVVLDICTKS